MLGVALAVTSAVLFGCMSVALALAFRRAPDAEGGALVTSIAGFAVCAVAAAIDGAWGAWPWPFVLAGLLAPGGSQILFVSGVRNAGASRSSVVVGMAPLVSVTIALVFLGEPAHPALLAGALLIVTGGAALAGERVRPETFRPIGVAFALGATLFFATRDTIVRSLSKGTSVPPLVAAAATVASGTAVVVLYLLATRGRAFAADTARAALPFAPAGVLWGLSYITLFEAFYHQRVTVVSPLVATESLFGVALAAIVLRRTEVVGRHVVTGALLVVGGGALIGVFR